MATYNFTESGNYIYVAKSGDTGNYTGAKKDVRMFITGSVTPAQVQLSGMLSTPQTGLPNNRILLSECQIAGVTATEESMQTFIDTHTGGKSSAGDSALIYAAALNHETVTQTSGSLIVGHRYYIQTYNGTDDFTNVGANDNVEGDLFTATGTKPDDWSAGSVLDDMTASTTAAVATNSIGAIKVYRVMEEGSVQFNAISDGLFNDKTIPNIVQSNNDFGNDSFARVVDPNTILFSMGVDLGYPVSAYLTITKYQ